MGIWWIVAGLVLVPLLLVALAGGALRRRVVRLRRLQEETVRLGLERGESLRVAQAQLHTRLARATVRAEELRRRVSALTDGPGRTG